MNGSPIRISDHGTLQACQQVRGVGSYPHEFVRALEQYSFENWGQGCQDGGPTNHGKRYLPSVGAKSASAPLALDMERGRSKMKATNLDLG